MLFLESRKKDGKRKARNSCHMSHEVGVGSTGSKKGHISKIMWGPPQIKILSVSRSKSKIFLKSVENSAVGAIFQISYVFFLEIPQIHVTDICISDIRAQYCFYLSPMPMNGHKQFQVTQKHDFKQIIGVLKIHRAQKLAKFDPKLLKKRPKSSKFLFGLLK